MKIQSIILILCIALISTIGILTYEYITPLQSKTKDVVIKEYKINNQRLIDTFNKRYPSKFDTVSQIDSSVLKHKKTKQKKPNKRNRPTVESEVDTFLYFYDNRQTSN